MWYAIHTKTGYEHDLINILKARVDTKAYNRFIIPMYENVDRAGGENRITHRKILPGYVLIDTERPEDVAMALKRVKEFARILSTEEADGKKKFAKIDRKDMDFFESIFGSGVMAISYLEFDKNRRLKKVYGPLAKYTGTSVTSLIGVAAKPLFIINNRRNEAPDEDDWKARVAQALRGDRNNKYCITLGNYLFEDIDGNYNYRYVCDLSDEYAGGGYYSRAIEAEGKVIIFPANAEHILILDPKTHEKKKLALKHETERDEAFAGFFNFILENPQEWWLFPNRYSCMVCFNADTERISYIKDEAFTDEYSVFVNHRQLRITAARWVFGTKRFFYGEGEPTVGDCDEKDITIPGIRMRGRRLFCLSRDGSRMRCISLDNGKTEERKLSLRGLFTGLFRDINDLDVMWFMPYEGTVFAKWTLSEDKWEMVDVKIDGLMSISRPEGVPCDIFYFSNGVFVDGKLILSPNWGNKFVELDTKTNEVKEWIPPFTYSTEDKNDYWYNGSIGYFYQDSWTLDYFFYYAPEHKTYAIDIREKTYSEIPISFDKGEVEKLSGGFKRDSQWMPYCCYEDVFNSLSDIATGQINGASFDKDRQLAAYNQVNASPDGDCGWKIMNYLRQHV